MKALRVRQDALPNKLLRMVIFLYNTHTHTLQNTNIHTHKTHTYIHTHTLQNTHTQHTHFTKPTHKPTHYKTHTYTHSHITKPTHTYPHIFTDGSKIGGKVGAAAVIIKDDKIIHQSRTTKSFISLSLDYTREIPIIRQNR